MSEIILTEQNFQQEVLNSEKPVLVDFWATWCGPCKMLAPTISQIADEQEGIVKVGKVDIDQQPQLAAQYGISSIPTLIVFKNGKVAASSVGVRSKGMIEDMLK